METSLISYYLKCYRVAANRSGCGLSVRYLHWSVSLVCGAVMKIPMELPQIFWVRRINEEFWFSCKKSSFASIIPLIVPMQLGSLFSFFQENSVHSEINGNSFARLTLLILTPNFRGSSQSYVCFCFITTAPYSFYSKNLKLQRVI